MQTLIVAGLFVATAIAQSNTVPGLDARLSYAGDPVYYGRRGAAHPGGEVAIMFSYYMCNTGTIDVPWTAPMNPEHPMFGFTVVREKNGRLEQITNQATTFAKHAFGAENVQRDCGPCALTGTGLRVGCSDAYSANTNSNRYYLAPQNEIDPWTGIWEPVGSYFDRGEPDVGAPANSDGSRSLLNGSSGVFADQVRNRVTLREQDLLEADRLFVAMHMILRGEDGDAHFDNLGRRRANMTWNGGTWVVSNAAQPYQQGSVLHEWTGATVSSARNGEDDGHFFTAVKVTDNGNGTWHYEYALQNFDNARGGASFRIPLCPSVQVTGVSFRDVDQDLLNEWSWSRVGSELVFSAPLANPLDWNTMFNFGFDCDQAPVGGDVVVDQARLGAGALSVTIATQVPSGIAEVTSLGAGCGNPAPSITVQGLPTLPNPGFGIELVTEPHSQSLLFLSAQQDNVVLAPGCTQFLMDASLQTIGFYVADGSGITQVSIPLPLDPAFDGVRLYWQAAQLQSGGPVFGEFAVSNGTAVRLGCR